LDPAQRIPPQRGPREQVGSDPSTGILHQRDQELVRAVLSRDVGTFECLIERMSCLPRILDGLNTRQGRPLADHDLADVMQDTLVVTWRKLETFDGSASLETWVFGIARFEFMNAVRKRRRRHTSELPEPDLRAAPEEESLDRLDHEILRQELAALDRMESEVIRSKHFDDLTFDEIGRRLGVSINTVKTRYYRGISHLLERLSAGFGTKESS